MARTPVAGRRLAVVYDINGPRVRLGMLWFFVEVIALVVGTLGLLVLFALTAAVAALQTVRCVRRKRRRPDRMVAGLGAPMLVVAGAYTTGMLGFTILVLTGAAGFVAWSQAAASKTRRYPLIDAAATVRCSLFVGLAGASVLVAARFQYSSVVGLILMVAAYEVGDFIVGSGAGNIVEGPLAGAIAALVIGFALTAVGIEPFVFPQSMALAGMVAVLAPAGQIAASLILPKVDAPASALRRIDSYIVLAPVWALTIGLLQAW